MRSNRRGKRAISVRAIEFLLYVQANRKVLLISKFFEWQGNYSRQLSLPQSDAENDFLMDTCTPVHQFRKV